MAILIELIARSSSGYLVLFSLAVIMIPEDIEASVSESETKLIGDVSINTVLPDWE